MTARLDYLVKSRNRCVILYSSNGSGGNIQFDIGPTAFCSNITEFTGEFATKGLTFASAALSRVSGSAGGNGGCIELAFRGATHYQAFQLPAGSIADISFERATVPNYSIGSTGMALITNNLSGGQTASIMFEFVTHHLDLNSLGQISNTPLTVP